MRACSSSRVALLVFAVGAASAQDGPRIIEWDRGVALQSVDASTTMYLWFYEWNMFEAISPGQPEPLNRNFADPGRSRTFFLSSSGLTALDSRDIHFNRELRPLIDRERSDGEFVFSSKWPASPLNAVAGYLVRASEDGRWVTGIGWDDFLSVQGHNPWSCMHACARVGPLAPGQSKTIRGRLALFRGSIADGVRYFSRRRNP